MELVMTSETLAEQLGISVDGVRKRWRSAFPELPFRRSKELTESELSALTDGNLLPTKTKKTTTPRTLTTPAADKVKPLPVKTATRRDWLLYGILAAPTIASIQNMYIISSQILEDGIGAVLLTVVLSATAFAFILAGVRQWYTYILALILVLFESFCNMTRIYGGLTHWEKAEPTRFLGIVTDIFNSGTYSTAIVLGTITAFCIAAVQYVAIFELNKSK